jgi:DNA replication protein DnaC
MNNNLDALLADLHCRTQSQDIAPDSRSVVTNFLAQELDARRQYHLKRLFAACGIQQRQMKTFDQLDWNFNPKIPKQDILAFRNSCWIDQAANLILIGDAGIGKSHIAKALCYEAILKGRSTYFISTFDLVSKIKKATHPDNKIDYYAKVISVLCLDELGYVYHKKEDTDLLFQIISKRSESLPTIVTSNLAPKDWGSIFSGPTASAILDRLNFNGKFLTWEGRSYRLGKAKR